MKESDLLQSRYREHFQNQSSAGLSNWMRHDKSLQQIADLSTQHNSPDSFLVRRVKTLKNKGTSDEYPMPPQSGKKAAQQIKVQDVLNRLHRWTASLKF